MKKQIMLALTLAFCISQGSFAKAGQDGNGGNGTSQWAKNQLGKIFGKFSAAYGDNYIVLEKKVPVALILKKLETTKIELRSPLYENGARATMLNFPALNLIQIDEERLNKEADKQALLIHEMLGLVASQINDTRYRYSNEIRRQYELEFGISRNGFPFGSTYEKAHQAWAASSFKSVDEATQFIGAVADYRWDCNYIGWKGTEYYPDQRYNPNQWKKNEGDRPMVLYRPDPLGTDSVAIAMARVFDQNVSFASAQLINGKVLSRYTFSDGSKFDVFVGTKDGKLFLKNRTDDDWGFYHIETVVVCSIKAGLNSHIALAAQTTHLDEYGILRMANGELVKVLGQAEAIKACPAGRHLPTFREYCKMARAFGGREIVEVTDVHDPAAYSMTNPGGKVDAFELLRNLGNVHLPSDFSDDANSFWSSSIDLMDPNYSLNFSNGDMVYYRLKSSGPDGNPVPAGIACWPN